MHPAVKGSPAKFFTCPSGGKLRISFQAWMQAAQNSLTGTGIAVYHNGEKIWPENEDWYQLDNSVTIKHITVEVAQGDDLAIVVDAINANNSFDATNCESAPVTIPIMMPSAPSGRSIPGRPPATTPPTFPMSRTSPSPRPPRSPRKRPPSPRRRAPSPPPGVQKGRATGALPGSGSVWAVAAHFWRPQQHFSS